MIHRPHYSINAQQHTHPASSKRQVTKVGVELVVVPTSSPTTAVTTAALRLPSRLSHSRTGRRRVAGLLTTRPRLQVLRLEVLKNPQQ